MAEFKPHDPVYHHNLRANGVVVRSGGGDTVFWRLCPDRTWKRTTTYTAALQTGWHMSAAYPSDADKYSDQMIAELGARPDPTADRPSPPRPTRLQLVHATEALNDALAAAEKHIESFGWGVTAAIPLAEGWHFGYGRANGGWHLFVTAPTAPETRLALTSAPRAVRIQAAQSLIALMDALDVAAHNQLAELKVAKQLAIEFRNTRPTSEE